MTASPFLIWVDSRERVIPPFPDGVVLERVTMSEADYTTPGLQGIGVVERKSGADFCHSITHDRERFEDELRRLKGYRWKLILIESDITALYRISAAHPNSILGTIASLTARWDCPTIFGGNAAGVGRLIAGVLSRWEARLESEGASG